MTILRFESPMPCSQQALYDYHASGVAFQRLVAPWETVLMRQWVGGMSTKHLPASSQFGDISEGAEVHLTVKQGPIGFPLVAKHVAHEEPLGFTDEQQVGPFTRWRHQHRFVISGQGASTLVDEIDFQAPLFGWFDWYFASVVRRTFQYRHQRTAMDIRRHQPYAHLPKKKIVVSGATGLIGQSLCTFLQAGGHTVMRLVRQHTDNPLDVLWNIAEGTIEQGKLEGVDAVIHLAGESIDGRWTTEKKRRILDSREQGTRLLSDTLASLTRPPEVFISTSAVGAYGNHPSEVATEQTGFATDFLGDVCKRWEASANSARTAGIRVVHPRLGVVLSGSGGALSKMLPPFLAGAGGVVGSGKQWMSWVALDDVVGVLFEMVMSSKWIGPVNVVAPQPVTNTDFTKALGTVLKRPTILPAPSFAIRMMFGEMGQTLLLEGRRVESSVMVENDFQFAFPDVESALRFELGRSKTMEGV